MKTFLLPPPTWGSLRGVYHIPQPAIEIGKFPRKRNRVSLKMHFLVDLTAISPRTQYRMGYVPSIRIFMFPIIQLGV